MRYGVNGADDQRVDRRRGGEPGGGDGTRGDENLLACAGAQYVEGDEAGSTIHLHFKEGTVRNLR